MVLAINGSPRKDGNTADMLKTVLGVCEKAGHAAELYQAGGTRGARVPSLRRLFAPRGALRDRRLG
ncbi:hypothetical protein FACS1894208_11940 [Clostridia bacterium]|nr:hypothetical protein FACS1894208_11940 [Clostridia bacterium]